VLLGWLDFSFWVFHLLYRLGGSKIHHPQYCMFICNLIPIGFVNSSLTAEVVFRSVRRGMTTGPVCPINFGFTFSATPFYLLLVRSHYMLSVNITIETEANGAVCSWGGIINYAKIDIFWARALIVAVAICGFFHLVGIGALILHWEFWNSHLPPPSLSNFLTSPRIPSRFCC